MLSKLLFALLMFFVSQQAVAKIIFNGDWGKYIGVFYDEEYGWKNINIKGKHTKYNNWNDYIAFWPPQPIPYLWEYATSSAANRIQILKDKNSPHGGYVARFEVHSGDHRKVHSGERTEMINMVDEHGKKIFVKKEHGHEFYGVSVKVPINWQPPKPEGAEKWFVKWGSFMQLHSPNAYHSPPAISFALEESFGLHLNSGELIKIIADNKTEKPKQIRKDSVFIPFKNGDLNKGRWVQFVLDINWSYDSSGSIRVLRRDEGERIFSEVLNMPNTPTLQYSKHIPTDLKNCPFCGSEANTNHYWRVGYYRSTSPGVTSVVWLGPVVRGTNLKEVEDAAFGKM